MSDRELNRLQDRILNLACNTFGLSADAGARLVFEAQAEIEAEERYPSSDSAIDRVVAATSRRLLNRQDSLRRSR